MVQVHQAIAVNPNTLGWNTAMVTDMSGMFSGATSATPNTSSWKTAKKLKPNPKSFIKTKPLPVTA